MLSKAKSRKKNFQIVSFCRIRQTWCDSCQKGITCIFSASLSVRLWTKIDIRFAFFNKKDSNSVLTFSCSHPGLIRSCCGTLVPNCGGGVEKADSYYIHGDDCTCGVPVLGPNFYSQVSSFCREFCMRILQFVFLGSRFCLRNSHISLCQNFESQEWNFKTGDKKNRPGDLRSKSGHLFHRKEVKTDVQAGPVN